MKKLLAYLLTVTAIAASLLMGASPASAAGLMRLYDGTSASSALLYTADPGTTNSNHCYRVNNSAEARTSYINNTSPKAWNVYTDGACAGIPGYIWPNSSGQMTGIWNNSISTYMMLN